MPDREVVTKLGVGVGPLRESDIGQLVPILVQHVHDRQTGEVLTDEIEDIKRFMREGVDEYGRTRKYLVARDVAGKVLGCMAYSGPDPDMVRHFGTNAEESAELLNAFVASEVFRGGGVGKKLFAAICDAARAEGKKALGD